MFIYLNSSLVRWTTKMDKSSFFDSSTGSTKQIRAKLFKGITKLLNDPDFINEFSIDSKCFSRKPILSFETVSLLILQLLKSSVSTELKSFHKTIFGLDEVVDWITDSAFCKARQKIKHQFFIELYKYFVQFFYDNIGGDRWFGYRILGIDGSEINLPSCKELLDVFKCHHINAIGTKIPQAQVSFLYDVMNQVTIDAQIDSFKVSEQAMLTEHLKFVGKNDLITADSNYGIFRILKEIQQTKSDFCIRLGQNSQSIQDFLASGKEDVVWDWVPSRYTIKNCKDHNVSHTPLKVRLIRIDLPENKTEVLAVSLLDQTKYTSYDMQYLYRQRWGTEEGFKKFIQRLLIEFFSSKKENGVLQDFYANVFMQNLVSFLAEPIKDQVYQKSKKCKFRYQINWTSALGDVRNRIVLLFVRTTKKVNKIIDSIQESFQKNTEAIRPDRVFPRDKRKKGARQKAFMNYKSAW